MSYYNVRSKADKTTKNKWRKKEGKKFLKNEYAEK